MLANDTIGVTFINAVLGRGILNANVNITLGVFRFTPTDDGTEIDPDLAVAARLRMDIACAKQLHESLGTLLASIESEQGKIALPGDGGVAAGKPN